MSKPRRRGNWRHVSASVNYLRAARGSDLTATARVARRAKSFCFCEVHVHDAEERLVAQGLFTHKIS